MGSLHQQVAIVTGGASGIGLATVQALAEKGVKVVMADRNEQAGKAAEEALLKQGAEVIFIQVDVADETSVERLVAETVKTYGKLDMMVNNAGVGHLSPTHELSFDAYNKVISVNQHGVFFGSKYAIREMLKTGGGSIVNTASIMGIVGEAGAFAYNASKGAVITLTKSLAVEYADRNIRVNAVCPGFIELRMGNKPAGPEFYDEVVPRHPLGRLGRPDEIAHGIVFLCENDFVTGASLVIDGGYTAK